MTQSAEYTLDKVEDVWRKWKDVAGGLRSKSAMMEIHKILSDSEKELLKDQGCEVI